VFGGGPGRVRRTVHGWSGVSDLGPVGVSRLVPTQRHGRCGLTDGRESVSR
jgi:hypothetical protein